MTPAEFRRFVAVVAEGSDSPEAQMLGVAMASAVTAERAADHRGAAEAIVDRDVFPAAGLC
jgi:hypothetical protein